MQKKWYQQKTTWTGIIMALTAMGVYFAGEMGVKELLPSLGAAAAFIFLQGSVGARKG